VLDVAVLSHYNAFETQPELLDLDHGQNTLSATVTGFLSRILKPGSQDPLTNGLIRWHKLPNGTERVLLPSAGGFSVRDATFITEELCNDIKSFSSTIQRTAIPGMVTLLCVMELHRQGASETSGCATRLFDKYRTDSHVSVSIAGANCKTSRSDILFLPLKTNAS
jgi:hypothetical protein